MRADPRETDKLSTWICNDSPFPIDILEIFSATELPVLSSSLSGVRDSMSVETVSVANRCRRSRTGRVWRLHVRISSSRVSLIQVRLLSCELNGGVKERDAGG